MKVMGLDIGDVRIGVAISDAIEMFASPYTVIDRKKENVTKRIGKNIQYTRSRDALKQIRPDGKIMWCFFENYPEGARARAEIFHDHGDNPIQTGWFPTEELAELHAIIQAIEYERTNK